MPPTENKILTTQPVQAGDKSEYNREWGRTEHVEKQFGIKRGSLYNLLADRKVEGKVLRIRGQVTGVRLWNMDSIRRYIEAQPDSFEDESEKTPAGEPGQCKSKEVTSLTE